jgi:hypothetical protein
MKTWGDLVIGKSGDRKGELTAETRKRGEETSEHLTTEARRHGEESEECGLYQGTGLSRAVTGTTIWALAAAVCVKVIPTIRATLREIFDESAYDRFLLRTHASRSVASYREFARERDAAMVKKPRCC